MEKKLRQVILEEIFKSMRSGSLVVGYVCKKKTEQLYSNSMNTQMKINYPEIHKVKNSTQITRKQEYIKILKWNWSLTFKNLSSIGFIKDLFLFFLFVCRYACFACRFVCMNASGYPQRTEMLDSLEEVTAGCELSDLCWQPELSPQEEQQVLWPAEPCIQPLKIRFLR